MRKSQWRGTLCTYSLSNLVTHFEAYFTYIDA